VKSTTNNYGYGGPYLLKAVQSFREEEKAANEPHDELTMYLDSGIEPTTDVIEWWGVSFVLLARLI